MLTIEQSEKKCTVNALKLSQPVGGALAFLGVEGAMPLLHGSQGCSAFGKVLFVRHFREPIPLQTTALDEVSTIMGGLDNLDQAIINIYKKSSPQLIGICSTGLSEVREEDVIGHLKSLPERSPELGDELAVVYASTPDYNRSLQEGWGEAVKQIIRTQVKPGTEKKDKQFNLLTSSALTPGDVNELRDIIESFGVKLTVLPDLGASLCGNISDEFIPYASGGTTLADIKEMGGAEITIAIGESMRPAAEELEKISGVPYILFERVSGLGASDNLMKFLSEFSGTPIPAKYRREREYLVDALLDAHFYYGGKRIALGLEGDLLYDVAALITELGASAELAVAPYSSSLLEKVEAKRIVIGDLEDLERGAFECDLIIASSHGRQASERLNIPLFQLGYPLFDRLGGTHEVRVGYRGTRELIYKIGNSLYEGQFKENRNEDSLCH